MSSLLFEEHSSDIIKLMLAPGLSSTYINTMSQSQSADSNAFESRLLELLYELDEEGEAVEFIVDKYSEKSRFDTEHV